VNFGVAAEALRSKAMRMKADYATIKTSTAAAPGAAESMAHKGSQEQQGAQAREHKKEGNLARRCPRLLQACCREALQPAAVLWPAPVGDAK